MIKFEWVDSDSLMCKKPFIIVMLNDEGEGFKYVRFVSGGHHEMLSKDFKHLVKCVENYNGKTNLLEFEKEIMVKYVARRI